MATLKQQTIGALIWNAVQNYGNLIISFATNIVLIRLLTPADFGTIGLLAIFVSLSNTIIDGGFNSALIQKKDLVLDDTYTIFSWNVFFSLLLMLVLIVCAPSIETYFALPNLALYLRVESSLLFINALCAVQTALMMKELNFRALAIRRLIGTVFGSVLGIVLAFSGFGVWSLIARDLSSNIVGCVLLWALSTWRPKLLFNFTSFKSLFKFGSYIFASSIIYNIYQNIQGFIIGKAYSASDLGYYSQAKKLEEIPISGSSSIISSVMFPVFSKVSDDKEYHRSLVRRNIRMISFVFSPIIILLICIAHPLIEIVFTPKWSESIPLFQILCIQGLFFPLNTSNTEIFKAIGRSDVYLTLQTSKQLTCILIIICFTPFGLINLMWGIALTGLISYVFNLIFTQRYFGYTCKEQLCDAMPSILISLTTGTVIYLIWTLIGLSLGNVVTIIVWTALFISGYYVLSRTLNNKSLKEFNEILKR